LGSRYRTRRAKQRPTADSTLRGTSSLNALTLYKTRPPDFLTPVAEIGSPVAESESVWNSSLRFSNIIGGLAVRVARRGSQIDVRSHDFKAVDPTTVEQCMISLVAAGG